MIKRPLFRIIIILLIFCIPIQAIARLELGGEFGYDKQVYGSNRQNKLVSRTYSGSMAIYFLTYTALELNYAYGEEITTENDEIEIPDTYYSVTSMQNKVITNSYGIGLRQALSGRGSRIRPLISLGYANQRTKDSTDMTFENDYLGTSTLVKGDITEKKVDSLFGSFMLQIYLTKGFYIKGSVKTIFPAFDFDKAKDDLRYLAGFSWLL